MKLRDRIYRLEELMDRRRYGDEGGGPKVIRILGGLPNPEGVRANIGPAVVIKREAGDTVEEFEERVIDTAIEMHAPYVTFGGLPAESENGT
jgi:hypothetical protein